MTISLPISDYDTVAHALYTALRDGGRPDLAAEAAALILRWGDDLDRGVRAVLELCGDLALEWKV